MFFCLGSLFILFKRMYNYCKVSGHKIILNISHNIPISARFTKIFRIITNYLKFGRRFNSNAMKILNKDGVAIKEIKNKAGEVIFSCGEEFNTLDDLDLQEVKLSDIIAEGLTAMNTDFRFASINNADLYWAIFT